MSTSGITRSRTRVKFPSSEHKGRTVHRDWLNWFRGSGPLIKRGYLALMSCWRIENEMIQRTSGLHRRFGWKETRIHPDIYTSFRWWLPRTDVHRSPNEKFRRTIRLMINCFIEQYLHCSRPKRVFNSIPPLYRARTRNWIPRWAVNLCNCN